MLSALSLATLLVGASASALKGFNYGSTDSSGVSQSQNEFESLFKAASGLEGASGFDSARLYTMIQGGTTNDPIQAIPAAITTKTKLLLGLWASGGDANFANELSALKSAIATYSSDIGDIVVGISVGSEDLYRDSEMGIQATAGVGVGPDVIVDYIKQVKEAISGTALANAPIGHVDTWTAWVNGSNAEVINEVDWVGFDGYPYFQNTMANSIDVAKSLFYDSYDKTKAAAGSKEVWITETGWPLSGPQENEATASVDNAKTYWDEVGCELFGSVNTFWYTLYDSGSSPSFGIVGDTLSSTPAFNLTCPASGSSSSSSIASSSTAASSTIASSTVVASSTAAASTEASTSAAAEASTEASSSAAAATTSAAAVTSEASASTAEVASSTSEAPVASTEAASSVAAATTTAATAVVNGAVGLSAKTAPLAALVAFFAAFM